MINFITFRNYHAGNLPKFCSSKQKYQAASDEIKSEKKRENNLSGKSEEGGGSLKLPTFTRNSRNSTGRRGGRREGEVDEGVADLQSPSSSSSVLRGKDKAATRVSLGGKYTVITLRHHSVPP